MKTREELVKAVEDAEEMYLAAELAWCIAWNVKEVALLALSNDGADDGGVKCKTHPDAPHGFARNASHNEGRYVCECEHWKGSE
jgi:hypothetical protein